MADSVYRQSLDEVVSDIKDLDLTKIPDEEVVLRKMPWDNGMIHRGITVSPDEERIDHEGATEGTNARDMVGYPCVVTLVTGTGRGWSDDLTTITGWRQSIRRKFNNQRLTTVTESGTNHVICRVTHEKPSVPQQYLKNHDVSQLIVWCWFLETRS